MSHATADAALVNAIIARLRPLGVSVYATEHDGHAGVSVHEKVKAGLLRADLVVVLLTRSGYTSNYVMQEIGFAQRDGKLTIPIVTPDTRREDLGMLSGLEYIVVDEASPALGIESLALRIERIAHAHRERQSAELSQRQRRQENIQTAALVLAVVGIILLTMSE